MAKGDYIEVGVRAGDRIEVDRVGASQNGRTVVYAFETESKVNWLIVIEQTRGGTTVQENRYMADQVVLLRKSAKETK